MVLFNNGHRLELDLNWWNIDPELSKNGTITLRSKKDEIFSIVASNVNWMTTTVKTIQEKFDDPPPHRRLDPR